MSTFTYNDWQNSFNSNQTRNTAARVGWFKLADDGDEALVRLNVSKPEDLHFAIIHTLGASANWMKVSCCNPFGTISNTCPLCAANATNPNAVGKASKRVYVEMLVSYKDKVTGQWSAPQAVVWDKPAGFAKEVVNKLNSYGDLKQVLLKITRNGAKGDMKTTYSMDYAVPTIFKPEMVPADFSAFDNFKIDKHSYYEKSVDEINAFLSTGSFPAVTKTTSVEQNAVANMNYNAQPTNVPGANVVTPGTQNTTYTAPQQPTAQYGNPYIPQNAPAQPVDTNAKFSGFSF